MNKSVDVQGPAAQVHMSTPAQLSQMMAAQQRPAYNGPSQGGVGGGGGGPQMVPQQCPPQVPQMMAQNPQVGGVVNQLVQPNGDTINLLGRTLPKRSVYLMMAVVILVIFGYMWMKSKKEENEEEERKKRHDQETEDHPQLLQQQQDVVSPQMMVPGMANSSYDPAVLAAFIASQGAPQAE